MKLVFKIFLFFVVSSFSTSYTFSQIKNLEVKKDREIFKEALDNHQLDFIIADNSARSRTLSSLSMAEEEWILLMNGKYSLFFSKLAENEKILRLIDDRRTVYVNQVPNYYKVVEPKRNDDFAEHLEQVFLNAHDEIQKNVLESELKEDQKAFLDFYLLFMRYQISICDEDKQDAALRSAVFFRSQYMNSDLRDFVIKYGSMQIVRKPQGSSIEIGAGVYFNDVSLKAYLHNFLDFNLTYTYTLKKLNFHGALTNGVALVRNSFDGNVLFVPNRRINKSNLSLGTSYSFFLHDRVFIAPYIESRFGLMRARPFINENLEFFNGRSSFDLGWGYGVDIYVNLTMSGCPLSSKYLASRQRRSGFYLKFKFGNSHVYLNSKYPLLQGSQVYAGISLGSYLNKTSKERFYWAN